jgi:fructoselysine-6-P-deglycase FrlB-like protein
VTIDRDSVDVVVVSKEVDDALRAVPVDEEFLDHLALRMLADGAFAGVALEAAMGIEELGRASGAKIVLGLRDSGRARRRFPAGAMRGP